MPLATGFFLDSRFLHASAQERASHSMRGEREERTGIPAESLYESPCRSSRGSRHSRRLKLLDPSSVGEKTMQNWLKRQVAREGICREISL